VEGKKRRQRQREPNWPDSPSQPRARTVRKITPVQRPGPSQSLDISSNLPTGEKVAAVHGSESQNDHLKLKLQVLAPFLIVGDRIVWVFFSMVSNIWDTCCVYT